LLLFVIYLSDSSEDDGRIQNFDEDSDEDDHHQENAQRLFSVDEVSIKKKYRGQGRGVLTERSKNNIHQRRISNSYDSTMSEGRRSQQKDSTMSEGRRSQQKGGRGKAKDPVAALEAENEHKEVRIEKLEKKLSATEKDRKAKGKQIQQLEVSVSERDDKIARLTSQIQALQKKRSRGTIGVRHCQVLQEWLEGKARSDVWAKHPFIGNTDDLMKIMKELLMESPEWPKFEALKSDNERHDLLQDYVTTYSKSVCQEVNQKRNNLATAIHKAWEERKVSGKHLPKAEELIIIMRRQQLRRVKINGDDDPEKEQKVAYNIQVAKNQSVFDWLVGIILSKVCGRNRWLHHKYHGLLSTYSPTNDPQDPFVTPGDEALGILMIENYEDRWDYELRCKNATPKAKVNRDHKDYKTLYSDNACGQCMYGGWNQEGRDRFLELRKVFRK
jgi:hypothetical protein